jgi:diguanylate cyclase (GGDEF)-like protein
LATILVADDRPLGRLFLVTLLQHGGHRVVEAADGAEALLLARRVRADLVVTDVAMPTLDGPDLVRRLRSDPDVPEAPVIFYSPTLNGRGVLEAARRIGGPVLVVPRPSEPEAILEAVDRSLGTRHPTPPPAAREELDGEHLRLLADMLTEKVRDLEIGSLRLWALAELGRELAGEASPTRLLERLAAGARGLLGAERALAGFFGPDGEGTSEAVACGPEGIVENGAPAAPGGVLRSLLLGRRPVRREGLPDDPRALGLPAGHPPVRSVLGALIATSAVAHGWLVLFNRLGSAGFSRDDARLAAALGAQAAAACEAARRHQELRLRAGRLEAEAAGRRKDEEAARAAGLEPGPEPALRTEQLREANGSLRLRLSEIEERDREIALLAEMGSLLQSCRTCEEAYAAARHVGARLFPGGPGALYVAPLSGGPIELAACWGAALVAGGAGFAPDACWALRRGRMHVVADPGSDAACAHAASRAEGEASGAALCVPLSAQGTLYGILHLRSAPSGGAGQGAAGDPFPEPRRRLAMTMAEQISLALANLRGREALGRQASRDPLTDLYNRRHLDECLEREVRRSARQGRPLGLVILDVDHFKDLNDRFGHETGDDVLRGVASILTSTTRREDVACRYGGDEFVLILTEATLSQTRSRAEEIRESAARLASRIPGGDAPAVTVSIGVAAFPDHGSSPGELLRAADAALYAAKAAGRDRIRVGLRERGGAA